MDEAARWGPADGWGPADCELVVSKPSWLHLESQFRMKPISCAGRPSHHGSHFTAQRRSPRKTLAMSSKVVGVSQLFQEAILWHALMADRCEGAPGMR